MNTVGSGLRAQFGCSTHSSRSALLHNLRCDTLAARHTCLPFELEVRPHQLSSRCQCSGAASCAWQWTPSQNTFDRSTTYCRSAASQYFIRSSSRVLLHCTARSSPTLGSRMGMVRVVALTFCSPREDQGSLASALFVQMEGREGRGGGP